MLHTNNGIDNKPESWYVFDAYIFKMDYVLCVYVEEGKEFVRTLQETGTEFTSIEIQKAIENFILTS